MTRPHPTARPARGTRRALALAALLVPSALSVLVGLPGLPGTAAAQPSVQLNRFQPSEQTNDGFAISSAATQGDMRFGGQFYLDYANDPLVYEVDRGGVGSESFSVVEHQVTGNLNVSLGLRDRLTVFIGLPIVFLQKGDGIPADLDGPLVNGDAGVDFSAAQIPIYLADGFALGDIYVGGRARLLGEGDDTFQLAVQGRLVLPTAQLFDGDQHYAGERGVAGQVELIPQVTLGRLRLIANIGAFLRPDNADCRDLGEDGAVGPGSNCYYGARQGDTLTFGIGATYALLEEENLLAILELNGGTTFRNFFDREETNLEVLAGIKYFHESGIAVGVGGGPGLTRGFGTPDFRVFAMVGYTEPEAGALITIDTDRDGIQDADDACPNEPEDRDGHDDADGCPDPDNDGDGVLDSSDGCPDEAEDIDSFADDDGCPEADNDGDGIEDGDDACPNDAEDADGFEDENGCPDPDNDGDGTPDATDRCPDEAGPSANQGCPWPDTDGDGIIDPLDSCVNEPGTEEFHGCPEQTDVVIGETGIEILQTIYFRTGSDVIQSRSFELLDHVAQVLNDHPEVVKVRVEGHTDSRGNDASNLDLSQRRAASVMTYLVNHGVDAARLEAVGYGETRPVVENARTAAQHAQNRRVVFTILEGGAAGVHTEPEAAASEESAESAEETTEETATGETAEGTAAE